MAARRKQLELLVAQAIVDCLTENYPDFSDQAATVWWVAEIAIPANRVGVRVDFETIRRKFSDGGWLPGVNCGEAFDPTDPRNFAGWIVGQWLESTTFLDIDRFVDEWLTLLCKVSSDEDLCAMGV